MVFVKKSECPFYQRQIRLIPNPLNIFRRKVLNDIVKTVLVLFGLNTYRPLRFEQLNDRLQVDAVFGGDFLFILA